HRRPHYPLLSPLLCPSPRLTELPNLLRILLAGPRFYARSTIPAPGMQNPNGVADVAGIEPTSNHNMSILAHGGNHRRGFFPIKRRTRPSRSLLPARDQEARSTPPPRAWQSSCIRHPPHASTQTRRR